MKNRNKLFNVIMAALIVLIAVSGVMLVGYNRGWFGDKSANAAVTAGETVGIAQMERSGVGYSLTAGTSLAEGDTVITKSGSSLTLNIEGGHKLTLNENTEVKIVTATEGNFQAEVISGEVFADVEKLKGSESFYITFGDRTASVKGTVFSVSVLTGSANVNVYEGEVEVTSPTAKAPVNAPGGSSVQILDGAANDTTLKVNALAAASLNDFNIAQAKALIPARELCFTSSELDAVTAAREAEKQAAADEQAKHEAEVIAQGGTEKVTTSSSTAGSVGTNGENVLTCTIQIRCDTILNNMGNLTAGKSAYVPSNGVILATSTVQFTDGETVFDVLKRACSYAGIQLEYSWTPMYNSYYIEGINNLYEFDCGNESGWMYKVNGWFPNYGCSSYPLKGGDTIVWCYTCNGLGADVGGSVY